MPTSQNLERDSACDCQHLREYLMAIIEERDKLYIQRMNNADDNVERAKIDNDARLAAMNEFRQSLTDQAREFVRRSEYLLANKNLEDRLSMLSDAQQLARGQARGIGLVWAALAVVVTIVLTGALVVVELIVRK